MPTLPQPAIGRVALVGAGPGDPGLLTVRGRLLLESADVVVYDALANPRLLAHAPVARHVFAGKRAAHHSMTQDGINALLVSEAKAGNKVVRLKGGDPFVFGRGGEEAEALVAAGVAFEVVPGITAAVAAAAYAGIPVTHRDLNTSLTLVTGHEKERSRQEPEAAARQALDPAESDATDWAALAKLPMLCFYMGVRGLPRIIEKLVENGKATDTPVAVVQWGTTPKQQTVTATLADIAAVVEREQVGSPAIIYVGEVVRLRGSLRWFDNRPLSGRTVLVTRTREQASELTAKLEALGANVLEAPTIEIAPPADPRPVRDALISLRDGPFDWDAVVFTSANGVIQTRRAMDEIGLDSRIFADVLVAAVGPATAEACGRFLAIRPDLVPERFDGEAVVKQLCVRLSEGRPLKGRGVMFLRADIGRAAVVDALREEGVEVRDVAVYETKPVALLPPHVLEAIDAGGIDAACFTSASTARNLATLVGDAAKLNAIRLVSIGPQTSAALRDLGLLPDVEARQATLDALVEATRAALPT